LVFRDNHSGKLVVLGIVLAIVILKQMRVGLELKHQKRNVEQEHKDCENAAEKKPLFHIGVGEDQCSRQDEASCGHEKHARPKMSLDLVERLRTVLKTADQKCSACSRGTAGKPNVATAATFHPPSRT
jgi:hypothetical protein